MFRAGETINGVAKKVFKNFWAAAKKMRAELIAEGLLEGRGVG